MVIDEPMRENGIRVLHFDDFLKSAVMVIVDNCVSVDLIRIGRPSLQDLTSLLRLGNSYRSGNLLPGSIIHIEQHHFVAQGGESRDGAAAAPAVLGATGLSAGDQYFVLP